MSAIETAIRVAGGQGALAEKLGLSKQAVNHWATGFRKPSAEQCVEIERVMGGQVTRADLRPDIFGPISTSPPVADVLNEYRSASVGRCPRRSSAGEVPPPKGV